MAPFEPAALPELLPVFYRRLFPHGPYGRWLGYGGVVKNYFQLREFSFTLRDDIYVRFQSFGSPQELERELQRINPYKIDIGAVYSHRPNQHNTVHLGAFQPQEKELVFDIDMTDYDDVRTCCSSAEICSKCWTLMTIAVRVIDRALVGEGLGDAARPRSAPQQRPDPHHHRGKGGAGGERGMRRRPAGSRRGARLGGTPQPVPTPSCSPAVAPAEDLGVRHRLWVYSGRRGVHCWVCDDAVRKWSPALRAAAVEYLTLVKGGAETVKKVNISEPVHPFIRRSVSVVEKYFEAYALVGQDILGTPESWDKVLALVPEDIREPLRGEFPKKRDSVQRWELLKGRMERTRRPGGPGRGTACYADWEIMLQYCFPRLDINVSKGVGHLLKSPFSVHPKTGRVSVPLDLQRLDQFDPFAVPTIRYVIGAGGTGRGGSRLCRQPPHRVLPSPAAPCATSWMRPATTGSRRRAGRRSRSGVHGVSEDGDGTGTGGVVPAAPLPLSSPTPPDYKKTSLAPYVRVFEQFVEEMERARRGELLRRSGESWAGTQPAGGPRSGRIPWL
ncbi:DNA primase small subunit isoform X3 [Rissa tridactyla]|uniref:DNA primase small subunit isoform X3 n=1 Tax=Rissa tridactyla TaxID=75485 RepID=UPI0023BAEA87|nr:DNA primase small subunit isoform X3 [Rissa tridactyla]